MLRRHDPRAPIALSHQHGVARDLWGAAGVASIAIHARIDSSLIRRIAPERNTSVRTPAFTARILCRSQRQPLPDDEQGPGGDSLSIGAKVLHPTFGRGIVRRREGRGDTAKAWVNFERGGIKLLVLKFANLRLIGD